MIWCSLCKDVVVGDYFIVYVDVLVVLDCVLVQVLFDVLCQLLEVVQVVLQEVMDECQFVLCCYVVLFDVVFDLVSIFSEVGVVLDFNYVGVCVYGCSCEDIIGQLIELFNLDLFSDYFDFVWEVLYCGEIYVIEVINMCGDGSCFLVEVYLAGFEYQGEYCIVVVVCDFSSCWQVELCYCLLMEFIDKGVILFDCQLWVVLVNFVVYCILGIFGNGNSFQVMFCLEDWISVDEYGYLFIWEQWLVVVLLCIGWIICSIIVGLYYWLCGWMIWILIINVLVYGNGCDSFDYVFGLFSDIIEFKCNNILFDCV